MSKSTTNPDVPPVVIVRGGLNMRLSVSVGLPFENEVQLVVRVAEQVGRGTAVGGVAEVLRTVN
jgi:hypothetical protein